MKPVFIIALAAAVLLCLAAGCTGTAKTAFDESDNQKTYEIEAGSTITVSLPENPTTGYEWTAQADGPLTIVDDEFIPPTSDLVGAGGTRVWTLQAESPGTAAFTAVYERSWETTGDEQTYILDLLIR
ncbi:MAG: protease inhibitor I42 family protein [Methanomicrobiales archaeon]